MASEERAFAPMSERLKALEDVAEAARPALAYVDAVLKHNRPTDPRNEHLLLGVAVGLRRALAALDALKEPPSPPDSGNRP